ncbi:MAG: GntR family transcriptional regulator [Trueperaceae bacterium]|nr:GntR family transcriptional regulator [Trueperaceae bacterium]
MEFQTLNSVKLFRPSLIRDEIYTLLRNELISGHLRPHQTLRVQDLADSLEVSKTPIHDALNRLVKDGLVESLNRGFRVKRFTKKEALDTYQVRERLEGLSASLAAQNHNEADLEELEHILSTIESCPPSDFVSHIQADLELHDTIARIANNDALKLSIAQLSNRMLGFRVVTKDENSNLITKEQHEKVIRAIAAGDAKGAEQAMTEHIRFFADLLSQRLEGATYVA